MNTRKYEYTEEMVLTSDIDNIKHLLQFENMDVDGYVNKLQEDIIRRQVLTNVGVPYRLNKPYAYDMRNGNVITYGNHATGINTPIKSIVIAFKASKEVLRSVKEAHRDNYDNCMIGYNNNILEYNSLDRDEYDEVYVCGTFIEKPQKPILGKPDYMVFVEDVIFNFKKVIKEVIYNDKPHTI